MHRFYIWVTSQCNLACKWCSQKYTMRQNSGYEMTLEEVEFIVNSCKTRGIHFDTIEITGGEASLWLNLEYGVRKFSEICDTVTLVTNGNNPERIKALGLKTWIVSASQATSVQLKAYEGTPALYNTHSHKKLPEVPFENVLPADCCVSVSPVGKPQNAIEYIKGKVYYCCDAFAHSEYTGTEGIVCSFNDDFISYFRDKRFDKEICRYCLCNHKIWNRI